MRVAQPIQAHNCLANLFLANAKNILGRNFKNLVIVTFLIHAAITHADNNDDAKKQNSNHEQGIAVTTVPTHQVEWPITIAAEGEIIPWEVAVISAKTTGFGATEVDVVAGDTVKKGQRLAQFDSRLLNAELNQAKANLTLAEANVKLNNTNLERIAKLQKKQLLSAQDYDAATNQAATASAARDQAQAALALSQIKLDDATLIAPDDGQILQRNINLGEVPQAGAALFTLLRQNKLQWLAHINAADLPRIKVDMQAEVNLSHSQFNNPQLPSEQATTEKIIGGKVRSVSTQLTSGARLGEVRVTLDGAPNLPVNTYAQGNLLLGTATALAVPAECLVIKDGKTWVFRVNQKSQNNSNEKNEARAEQVLVELGRRQNGEIELLAGTIKNGDVIVHEGAGFLNDGDMLSIKKPEKTSENIPQKNNAAANNNGAAQ